MARQPKVCPFTIVADANEHLPQHLGYRFEQIEPPVQVVTADLWVGDYTIRGFEQKVIVERKSLDDLYASFGKNKRDNMIERVSIMNGFRAAFVVVEANYLDAMAGHPFSRVHPRSLSGTIIALMHRYRNVHWVFIDGRDAAERMTFRLLERYHTDTTEAANG